LDICIQRQVGHKHDGVGDVPDIHSGLDHGGSIRLSNTAGHALAHFGNRISDVELTARDIVLSAIK
jgi:hypothetical protein